MLVTIFYYDDENYFSDVGVAQKVGDEVLLPPNATAVTFEPDATKFAKWNGTAWEFEDKPTKVEDFVGIQVSHKSQTPHNCEMRALLQHYVEVTEGWRVTRGPEEEGLWWGVEEIPEATEIEKKQSEISELKGKLASTDYVVMKISEGVATTEEYAGVLEDRQSWRARINELEKEIASLEA